MTTTAVEKNAILLDARNLVRMAITGQRRFMSIEDYEELESDCLMAASRAIDDYDPSRGCRLSSLMFRYIIQKRIKVLKHRESRTQTIHDTESLEDSAGLPASPSRHSPRHDALVQERERFFPNGQTTLSTLTTIAKSVKRVYSD